MTESGWGEFEIKIVIYFKDVMEKPVSLFHILKLYPNDDTIQQGKRTVIAETYDELVFIDPSQVLASALAARPTIGGSRRQAARDYEAEEDRQLELMETAKKRVRHLLRSKRQELEDVQGALAKVEADVKELEEGKIPAAYQHLKKIK